MEKILVTGGAGFIGQNLISRLLFMEKDVTILDYAAANKKEVIEKLKKRNGKNLKVVKGKVEDIAARDFPKIDTIFHLGSPCSIIQFNENPTKCMEITLASFTSIMEFAKQNKILVVYPSSASIYGNTTTTTQKESDIPAPPNLYALSKLKSEEIADFYYKKFGVNSIGLRIFATYGMGEEQKGNKASLITIFLNKMIKNEAPEIWGNGKQGRDFVFINDVVDMLIKCGMNPKTNIINVGSGVSTTFQEVINIINKDLNKHIEPIYKPKPTHYLENIKADMSLVRKLYNFKPTSLEKGIKKYVEYLSVKQN